MMTEMRRMWYLLDSNDNHIRPRYIRSALNILADTLSRELDTENWQLNPQLLAHLQDRWGPHSIDRFVSMLNTRLLRFNARWRDPQCEDIDCLHLPDAAWRRETTIATLLGLPYHPLLPNCASQAQPLPLWPSTRPTNRSTKTSSDSHPISYISRKHGTSFFPAGSASPRGSDHPHGASWSFESHPFLALHPTRRHRLVPTRRTRS
jgi:hypothetical protein